MKHTIFILFFLFFTSCKNSFLTSKDEEPIAAEVGGKKLLMSEVNSMISDPKNEEDSIRMLKGLINNWVKDQLMIIEAEKNMPADINLQKMIEDYRSSLLLYNYETKLAGELLDTVITSQQKEKYYNENADQFILSESIGRYMMAKIPSKVEGLDNFYANWKKGSTAEISDFCKKHAEYIDLNETKWKTISELESLLPKNLVSRSLLDDEESIRKKDKGYDYFIKVIEYADKENKPPFDYIQAKIEKVLLNERKKDLLKMKKQQLFDKYGSSSAVKVYVN